MANEIFLCLCPCLVASGQTRSCQGMLWCVSGSVPTRPDTENPATGIRFPPKVRQGQLLTTQIIRFKILFFIIMLECLIVMIDAQNDSIQSLNFGKNWFNSISDSIMADQNSIQTITQFRVAKVGSLTAITFFVWRVVTIFSTNAMLLRVIAKLQI